MPRAWVAASTRVDTRTDPSPEFQYCWWTRPGDGAGNDFWAQGNHWQFIYVVPSRDLVLVRSASTTATPTGPSCWPAWPAASEAANTINQQLAEHHIMLMGATTYRLMAEIVAAGDDPTFPRMAELPKIVFSKTLKPPLTWANTTVMAEPVETAVPALNAMDDTPMRTIGSPSLVRSLFP